MEVSVSYFELIIALGVWGNFILQTIWFFDSKKPKHNN
jgi:hypothetical protein